ncbi:MAG: hypothetical protein V2J55_05230 [Candidatus Competibacteraceae bacterium]|jgi:hypothetical protein|nr:hypothetical protein [Candidatus Competibacteraceae bacterium]
MPHEFKLSSQQVSAKDLPVLKIILSLTKTNAVASWDYTDNAQVAAALMVDTDSDEGRSAFKKLINNDRKQALIAYGNPPEGLDAVNDIFVLPKPLRSKNIIPVLHQAAEWFINIQQESLIAKEPSKSTEEKTQNTLTKTGLRTQTIRRIINLLPNDQNKALHIVEKANNQLVVIDRWRNRYYVYSPINADISKLLLSDARNFFIEELERKQLNKEIEKLIPHELDITLWKAALSISDGQLFDGLLRTESFQLRRWPDLKRLGNDPLHMKLTAMLRRGGTIDYLADFLNAPIDEVIRFTNACYALGFLDHQHQPIAQATSAKKQLSNSKRGLLSRIRNRLGI